MTISDTGFQDSDGGKSESSHYPIITPVSTLSRSSVNPGASFDTCIPSMSAC